MRHLVLILTLLTLYPVVAHAQPVSGPVEGVFRISGGGFHTCVMNIDPAVACFGNNRFGQVGVGNFQDQANAKFVINTEPWLSDDFGVNTVAAGGAHSCLLTNLGDVHCWGSNSNGQLGTGSVSDPTTAPSPTAVISGGFWVDTGALHTCALNSSEEVECWGHNHEGQLGNGTTTDSATPVAVSGLGPVIEVYLGGFHSCAITTSNQVKCWGSNNFGQIGDSSNEDSSVPLTVNGLAGTPLELAAGMVHTCARISGNLVQCWGGLNGATPTIVTGMTDIVQIVAGGYHVCGRTSAGEVKCAGINSLGQLGDGTTDDSMSAVTVIGLESGVTAIGAGGAHTCAVTADGEFVCWGDSSKGQLGVYSANYLLPARGALINSGDGS